MDGTRFKPQFDTAFHGEIDRISKLPDEIISEILCLVPLREAARTSILSPRWLDLWKHTLILDFDNTDYSPIRCEMRRMESKSRANLWNVELVNSVLQSHKALGLKIFRISFYVNKSDQSHVVKWLEFVFTRGVERLFVDLVCDDPKHMVVLEELLRESGLCCRPQNLVLFKPLKSLCLNHMKSSGEAVKLILRSCPSLEELVIGWVVFTSDVEVCGSNQARLVLKRLEVNACSGYRSLKVSAPNLTWLMVDDTSENLSLGNLPKLVGAEFRFVRERSPNSLQNALFRFSSQLEVLNLTLHYPEVFLTKEFPQMPDLKKLVLEYHGVKTHSLLPVTALVWAAPRLEEFKLVFVEAYDSAPVEVTREARKSRHQHLKVFEFEGLLRDALKHTELVTYISENSIALQELIIDGASIYGFWH